MGNRGGGQRAFVLVLGVELAQPDFQAVDPGVDFLVVALRHFGKLLDVVVGRHFAQANFKAIDARVDGLAVGVGLLGQAAQLGGEKRTQIGKARGFGVVGQLALGGQFLVVAMTVVCM